MAVLDTYQAAGVTIATVSAIVIAGLLLQASFLPFKLSRLIYYPHPTLPRDYIEGEIKKRSKGPTGPVAIELISFARLDGDWREILVDGYPISLKRMDGSYEAAPLRQTETRFMLFRRDHGQDKIALQWRNIYTSLVPTLSDLPPGEYRLKVNLSGGNHSILATVAFSWTGSPLEFRVGEISHQRL